MAATAAEAIRERSPIRATERLAELADLTFSVNCPYSYSNPDPATIVLNPGAGQQTLVSIGPDTVNPGDPPYSVSDCDSVVAQIGDVIQSAGAVFAAVDGPA